MAELLEGGDHLRQRLVQRFARGVAHDLGVQGLFVRIADAGEVGNLARDRFLVEAFDIAFDQRVERGSHEHLHETRSLGADFVPHLAIRRDRRGDGDAAAAGDQSRHIADAPDVGVAVFLRESQTLREVGADLVAVEQLDVPPARLELGFQRIGDGRLARTRQSCEPNDESSGHTTDPSRPQRRLIPRSNEPNSESMTTPMTKITTMIASSCSMSAKSRATWICWPIPIWRLAMPRMISPAIRRRQAKAQPCFRPPMNDGSAAGRMTCRYRPMPRAPITRPTRTRSGCTWSTPLSNPPAIEGAAPRITTKKMAFSLIPKSRSATGNHTIDGID